jgi:tetratricopeptide (TPR) repeat protein
MLTRFVKRVRLGILVVIVSLSGCSISTPKPMVVDTSADALEPIPVELKQSFGDALALMQNEEFLAAENLLFDITLEFPLYAGPWSNLAIAQSKQGKFKDALVSINAALHQNDKFCQALSIKGVVLRELGKFKLAKEQYLAARACNPLDILTLYNLGVLSDLYLHDNVAALSYYQQYLIAQGQLQDETVKSWVIDLKRRVSAELKKEFQQEPIQNIEKTVQPKASLIQLAGEE